MSDKPFSERIKPGNWCVRCSGTGWVFVRDLATGEPVKDFCQDCNSDMPKAPTVHELQGLVRVGQAAICDLQCPSVKQPCDTTPWKHSEDCKRATAAMADGHVAECCITVYRNDAGREGPEPACSCIQEPWFAQPKEASGDDPEAYPENVEAHR